MCRGRGDMALGQEPQMELSSSILQKPGPPSVFPISVTDSTIVTGPTINCGTSSYLRFCNSFPFTPQLAVHLFTLFLPCHQGLSFPLTALLRYHDIQWTAQWLKLQFVKFCIVCLSEIITATKAVNPSPSKASFCSFEYLPPFPHSQQPNVCFPSLKMCLYLLKCLISESWTVSAYYWQIPYLRIYELTKIYLKLQNQYPQHFLSHSQIAE